MNKLPRFPEEHLLAASLKTPAAAEKYERFFIGSQIKKMRRKSGMKQAALARALKTSQSAVARMEAGKQNLTLGMLVKLGIVLGKKLQVKFQ